MPRHREVPTLRKSCMAYLAKNWDFICYSARSPKEMADLLENDGYLEFPGPFTDFPSTILEDIMDAIKSHRSLSRKYLHMLLCEQLLKLNFSFGVGEIYYGLQFLPRCTRLRDLNLAFLRHVEPPQIMKIIPYLGSIVVLNLGFTSVYDPVIEMISEYCPNLHDLNLASTYVSDQGLSSLCGADRCDGEKRCQKLQRLTITETRATWVGAYTVIQNLPNLTDFDFDKIFQVFEHLDPMAVVSNPSHPVLKLKSLYSTAACIRSESIDAAVALCPKTEQLSIMNSWINNEIFYKFMQFECLKSLTIFNCEGKTLEFEEGILPVLQVVGPNLENLILSKFEEVDLVSLGRSCPRLRKMALSGIDKYITNEYGPVHGLYSHLSVLELWLDCNTEFYSENILLQILGFSTYVENILIKKSDAFSLPILHKIWVTNPMTHLGRLTLDSCNGVTYELLKAFFNMENDLTTLRIWSCPLVTADHKNELHGHIQNNNLDTYLEWFE